MAKSHASYHVLITRCLRTLNPFNKSFISPISIKKFISNKYGLQFLKISNYYFRRALTKLLESDQLEKHESKYQFRLKPKYVRKQESKSKVAPKKKTFKVTKKAISKNVKPKKLPQSPAPTAKKATPMVQKKNKPKKEAKNEVKTLPKAVDLEKKPSLKRKFPIWQFYDHFNVEARVQSPDGWYAI